ncbi:hypothetical protein ACFYON_28935 [Micromonospora sp. NPDC005686]|uniref:hypothetical protein n=1 Tax=Micromonospora TaxID=1873 RepID=UPI001075A06D
MIGLLLITSVASCARPAEQVAADPAVTSERLDLLSQRIGGTPRQRTAGEVLQYHAYQDGIRDCMKDAGFTYEPPPFLDPYRGRTVIHMGIGTGQWLAPINEDRLGITDTAELKGPNKGDTGPSASYRNLDPEDQEKFQQSLTTCIPRNTPEVNFPSSYHSLAEKYNQMLTDASKAAVVKAAGKQYPTCMAQGGFKVNSHDELVKLVLTRMGDAQPPTPGQAPSSNWSAVVQTERAAARLDADCRQPAYEAALNAVAPSVAEFERSHEAELALVSRQWHDIEAQAAAYPEFK